MNNTQYARLLTEWSLDIQPNESLLISTSEAGIPLALEVYREALLKNAHPDIRIIPSGLDPLLYSIANENQLKTISPIEQIATEKYDASLRISAQTNTRALQNIPPSLISTRQKSRTELHDTFFARAARGELKWTLCQYPTDATAQEAGMSTAEYTNFISKACFLDTPDPVAQWKNLSITQRKIADYLNTCKQVRYISDDIDISFSTAGRTWINSDGKHNMPSGEVFTSPVEDSVEGHARFSFPGLYMGREIEGIELIIKKGRVIQAHADRGQDILDEILTIPGADRFGEVAIGTNHGINRFTRNMLFDEKIGGTVHLALGSGYPETGSMNKSAIHWDLLADMRSNGQIFADGKLIYSNGIFDESLVKN